MRDDCSDCALLVTANPAASRLAGLHDLLHEDEEPLGLCEWGGATNFCVADATARYSGGEALCYAHGVALYGE